MIGARWLLGDSLETVRYNTKLSTTETWMSSDCSGQYSYLMHFQMTSFTKVVLIIYLVTDIVDWEQMLKNQRVQIEINCVQPGKLGNFFRLVSFPFQYSSEYISIKWNTVKKLDGVGPVDTRPSTDYLHPWKSREKVAEKKLKKSRKVTKKKRKNNRKVAAN